MTQINKNIVVVDVHVSTPALLFSIYNKEQSSHAQSFNGCMLITKEF